MEKKNGWIVAITGGQNLRFTFVRTAAKRYISDIKKG